MSDGRTYGGETAADRADRRRRQLMEAGLTLYGNHGYRSTTVREICREARVADRNFYEYFANTEDFLLAVYDEGTGRLRSAVLAAAGDVGVDDVSAFAEVALRAILAELMDDPRLGRLVWLEVLGVSPRVEQAYIKKMEDFAALIMSFLPIDSSLVPSASWDLLGRAAVGGVSHILLSWVVAGMKQPAEELVDGLVAFLMGVAAMASPVADLPLESPID